ncbi:hypothetical protein KAR91_21345 [Candidatus Pacearchaeota archaeon]|nr:hypothetical protein [Candidatus Pacearchaeota archaeon]
MRKLLEDLKLPKEAVDWLVMLFDVTQVFDDFADGDKVERKDFNKMIHNTLVFMPTNPFFRMNADALWPVVSNNILKWQASDAAERAGKADAMSFAWRAGFYDIVLFVYALYYGHEKATEEADAIMALYGEKFEGYMQEVTHA